MAVTVNCEPDVTTRRYTKRLCLSFHLKGFESCIAAVVDVVCGGKQAARVKGTLMGNVSWDFFARGR